MIRIVIIEDQTAVREMISLLLAPESQYQVVGQEGRGQEAYSVCRSCRPDLVILDIMIPGLNGLEILRRIKKNLPRTKVLIFSGQMNRDVVREVISAGAEGFVEKTASLAELKKGIEVVSSGGTYFGVEVSSLLREEILNPCRGRDFKVLSPREIEVLQMIAESCTTKEVAARLNISLKTADNHRNNLMRKLDLHDVASLTRYAYEKGLIELNRGIF